MLTMGCNGSEFSENELKKNLNIIRVISYFDVQLNNSVTSMYVNGRGGLQVVLCLVVAASYRKHIVHCAYVRRIYLNL
jgi:DUF917 family protein